MTGNETGEFAGGSMVEASAYTYSLRCLDRRLNYGNFGESAECTVSA